MAQKIKDVWAKSRNVRPWILILLSLSLSIPSHFNRMHREQKRAQRQTSLDAINRDCAQLQSEENAFYRKAKAVIAKGRLEDEDVYFAEHYDEKSESFKARYAAIQRRCQEFNASAGNQ